MALLLLINPLFYSAFLIILCHSIYFLVRPVNEYMTGTRVPDKQVYDVGDVVRLTCLVRNASPGAIITWRRNEHEKLTPIEEYVVGKAWYCLLKFNCYLFCIIGLIQTLPQIMVWYNMPAHRFQNFQCTFAILGSVYLFFFIQILTITVYYFQSYNFLMKWSYNWICLGACILVFFFVAVIPFWGAI